MAFCIFKLAGKLFLIVLIAIFAYVRLNGLAIVYQGSCVENILISR